MRIVTLNVNGIRSAARKGLFEWLPAQAADFVCLQEIKAQAKDVQASGVFWPPGYHCHYLSAEKPGYSGVAVYSKNVPDFIHEGIGVPELDAEGRYLEFGFGDLSIASVYLPSGTSGPDRQSLKYLFMERFLLFLRARLETGRRFIICGDWNIAHKPIDLKNWRGNQKNSGFLPEERAWLDRLFGDEGWGDAFRAINQEPEQYTWWSNRGQAWAKNVGWRIDYHVVSNNLLPLVSSASIFKDQRFSDHAPLSIDYDLGL